jgi:flagellar hook-associated protein 2
MSLSPLTISGVSQFSADFQTILDRAVKIGQIPIQQLQNRDIDVLQKKTLLGGLTAAVSGLAGSLEGLSATAGRKALAASSSKLSVLTAVNSGAEAAVTYTINSVTSIAKAASERTVTGYADSGATPVGSTGDFQLIVGDEEYDFTLANNTLVGLRDKINSLNAGVNASILTTTDGNYLSISASLSGETTLELRDDPEGANTNLLTGTNQGSDLVFELNGIEVRQPRNLVNSVIPGVTLTVLAESADPVEVELKSDRSELSEAISSFVSSYNSLRGQVNGQMGAGAGLLSGNSLIVQLSGQLRQIGSHRAADGEVRGLSDLGITFNTKGELEFDSDVVDGLSEEAVADAFTFLDDSAEGIGQFAAGLRQFSDPISGMIKLEQQGLDRIDQALQSQIATLTERLVIMQRGMALKLQQADALLASLESQQTTVKASLQGLSLVLYGKNDK